MFAQFLMTRNMLMPCLIAVRQILKQPSCRDKTFGINVTNMTDWPLYIEIEAMKDFPNHIELPGTLDKWECFFQQIEFYGFYYAWYSKLIRGKKKSNYIYSCYLSSMGTLLFKAA
ncbi:hypothetical protein [Candidatus Albibeggiatoa sp. nov. NOAA]|uniref:hypothetical protein n=1 Tax=Candidatus Albibeggiatoa sp. nov. NOAA TaxID=3162724 RepID=UPI0032FA4915|nr:hypothetical protein [Thiotrichaceae bacterium]